MAEQIKKYPNKLREMTITFSFYTNTVQCGGKKGESVKLQQTSCAKGLCIHLMKVWGVELLNCYNSDDQCGRFNNVDSISYL